jgi:hypothetical protein
MPTINQDHAITARTRIAPACAIGVHLDSFHPLDGITGCKIPHRYLANATKDLKAANLKQRAGKAMLKGPGLSIRSKKKS